MKFKEFKQMYQRANKRNTDERDKNKKLDKKMREHLKKTGKEYYGNNIVQYVAWVDQERSHLRYLYLSPSALPILILILLCYFCFSNLELFGGFLKTLLIFITIGSAITWIFDYIFKNFLKLWLIELPWWFKHPLKFYYLFFPTLLLYGTYYLLWKIYF